MITTSVTAQKTRLSAEDFPAEIFLTETLNIEGLALDGVYSGAGDNPFLIEAFRQAIRIRNFTPFEVESVPTNTTQILKVLARFGYSNSAKEVTNYITPSFLPPVSAAYYRTLLHMYSLENNSVLKSYKFNAIMSVVAENWKPILVSAPQFTLLSKIAKAYEKEGNKVTSADYSTKVGSAVAKIWQVHSSEKVLEIFDRISEEENRVLLIELCSSSDFSLQEVEDQFNSIPTSWLETLFL